MGFRSERRKPIFRTHKQKGKSMTRIKDGEKPLYFYRSIQKL